MAQGDPPVYQLVDSNGNVQAEIRHNLAQSLIIDQLNGSDIDFQQSDLSNIASVSTDRASIGEVAARAGLTTDQSIPGDLTDAVVNIDSQDFADTSVVVVDTTNNQFTIQEEGTYEVEATINWRDSANWSQGDTAVVSIAINGSREDQFEHEVAAGNSRFSLNTSYTQPFSSGDAITFEARQDSGSAIDITGTIDRTNFEVTRIG